MIDYRTLGSRIRNARLAKNLTQEALASLIGCAPTHVSNIENNHTKVSLPMLVEIANALDTGVDYLLMDQYDNLTDPLLSALCQDFQSLSDQQKVFFIDLLRFIKNHDSFPIQENNH